MATIAIYTTISSARVAKNDQLTKKQTTLTTAPIWDGPRAIRDGPTDEIPILPIWDGPTDEESSSSISVSIRSVCNHGQLKLAKINKR